MFNTIFNNIFNIFTTRELVIIIWSFIFMLIIFASTMFNTSLKKSFDNLIASLFSSYIVVTVLIFIIYSILITMILINLSFWQNIYFKELVIWCLFSGIVLIIKSVTTESFTKFYREYFLDQFKIIIVIQFIIKTFTFDFIIEMIMVPFVTFLSILNVVAGFEEKYKKFKQFLKIVLMTIGWIIFVFTILDIYYNFEKIDINTVLITFFIPIFLSLLCFPLAYFFALFSLYEKSLNIVMYLLPDNQSLKRKTKYKIFLTCHISIKKIEYFLKKYSRKFYRNMSEVEIDEIFNEFNRRIKN